MKNTYKKLFTILFMATTVIAFLGLPSTVKAATGATPENAITIDVGKKNIEKKFSSTHKVAYYNVTTKDAGKIKFTISIANSKSDYYVAIYYKDAYRNAIASKTISYNKKKKKSSGTVKSDFILPAGEYYFEVRAKDEISKKCTVAVKASVDKAKLKDKDYTGDEGNNSYDTAQKLTLGKSTGTLVLSSLSGIGGDRDYLDWLKFKLPEDDNLVINCKPKNTTGTQFKLLLKKVNKKGEQTVVAQWEVGKKNLSVKTDELSKGTYYIQVYWADTNAVMHDGGQISYTLTVDASKNVSEKKSK